MKREAAMDQKKAGKYIPPKEPSLRDYPLLARVLTDAWWDDGAPRDCPSLGIRVFADSVQLSIVDIGERRSTETTAPTLHEALQLVEALCGQPCLPWRMWDRPGKRQKRG